MEPKLSILISLQKLEWRSDSLMNVGAESRLVVRSRGQVLSPPMDGFASMNNKSSSLWPSTTLRAAGVASSLCVTPVCDLSLLMCVLYPMLSLVRIISLANFRRSLCGWLIHLGGSMAYLRMALIPKALSVGIERAELHLLVFISAIV